MTVLDRLSRRSPGRSHEAGAAILEYVAALALLLIVVGALVVQMAPAGVALKTKVCEIYSAAVAIGGGGGGGGCGGGTGPGGTQSPTDPAFDPKPTKCKVATHDDKVSAEVTVLVIKIGENANLIETRYSDGTVTYTATNGGQLGVVVSAPGAEVRAGGGEAGEKVDFGGDLKVDAGSTWTFKNQAEADAMRKQLDDYRHDQTLQSASAAYAIYRHFHPMDPPRPPDHSVVNFTLSGYLEGKAGVKLPWSKGSDNPLPSTSNVSPPEIGIKFGADSKWSMITDLTNGNKTYTSTGELYGQGSLTGGPLKGEYKGILGSSVAITRDKDNNLTNITFVNTNENKGTLSGIGKAGGATGTASVGGSGVNVTTSSLDIKTPEQRALVENWLNSPSSLYISPETAYPDKLVPGDALQNLMFTNATSSKVDYNKVTDKTGFALKIKAGVSVGIDLSDETSDSTATDATYLGAPGSGQTSRPDVNFPECVGQ